LFVNPFDWLRVDPERRFFTPSSNAGFGAAERVNLNVSPAISFQLLKTERKEG